MTTLAADKPRTYELGDVNELPVVAADIIFEGAAVGDNGSGVARPLVAGDPFRGFAIENADNATGAAGD
ncbi:MAG: cytoplasmic protein, partial [Rhodospirillales bacterium]|nr:cytoplasmic protein [Rhodospirillales bacterium]